MYIERLLTLPSNQSFFLFGPRNTGKSTLIKKKFPDGLFIDLLDIELEEKFEKSPSDLKRIVESTDKNHIVIDEIQKIPLLLDIIHYCIEKFPQKHFIRHS